MNLLTISEPALERVSGRPVIQLAGVSVRYRMPRERIPSFKEYAIRWLKREIRYHEFWALRDITLEVNPGEVFGIIGPNGAGKSTLLKVIARVLRPIQGVVRVRGMVAPLLELGAGFDFELTGRENIYLNGAILGFSKQALDQRIEPIIEFAGLRDFIDAPLRTYSTGMVARLGFAVATDQRPDILIVDEILSVGDAEFQTRSFERIQSFQAEGTTILLVSHGLGKVEEMCSRVMWLDHGQIVALGSAKAVIDGYLGRLREDEAERLAQEPEEDALRRWGSRKIEITRVCITNLAGVEQTIFQTGEPLILQIGYIAHEAVLAPIFGVGIHRNDGVHITGPNTSFSGMELGLVEGEGVVTYKVPYLPLLEGLYHFSVAVVNHQDDEIYDYHDRAFSFRVLNPDQAVKERYGLMTMRGSWEHHQGSSAL
jgi:ABC-type polysaccharide/polyol phosphate transport system ATPase subunit